jgi:hypothetical protein
MNIEIECHANHNHANPDAQHLTVGWANCGVTGCHCPGFSAYGGWCETCGHASNSHW